MKIYSVYDPAFKPYGQIVEGMEDAIGEILEVLKDTPLPEGTDYVPEEESLQELPAMVESISTAECLSSWAGATATTPD